jgi:hypothetical protein
MVEEVLVNDSPRTDLVVADQAVEVRVEEEGDNPKSQTREGMVMVAEEVVALELSWLAVAPGVDDERHSGQASVEVVEVTRPFSGCTHRPRQLLRLLLASCHSATWAARLVVVAPWA